MRLLVCFAVLDYWELYDGGQLTKVIPIKLSLHLTLLVCLRFLHSSLLAARQRRFNAAFASAPATQSSFVCSRLITQSPLAILRARHTGRRSSVSRDGGSDDSAVAAHALLAQTRSRRCARARGAQDVTAALSAGANRVRKSTQRTATSSTSSLIANSARGRIEACMQAERAIVTVCFVSESCFCVLLSFLVFLCTLLLNLDKQ